MAKNTGNTAGRMVVTRVFDATRELIWKAWTDPEYTKQWWGPKGFATPVYKMDFRVGGKFLICMRSPDGQEFWNAGEYHEIVLHEKIVSSMYFSDPQGNEVEPAQYGIEHEAIGDAHDITTFEDFGNGQTKVTFVGNETMEDGQKSGQLEGMKQILEKFAALVEGVAQARGEEGDGAAIRPRSTISSASALQSSMPLGRSVGYGEIGRQQALPRSAS